jgi:lipopolysaccharide transport system permease protein
VKTLAKVSLLYQHRSLIVHSVGAELRYRTAGTSFGLLWLVLTPLLLLAAYSIVYLVIFRVRPTGMTEVQYVAYLFCGLVPFLALSEAMLAGLGSLSTSQALLSSTVFPAEILPLRAVIASQSGFATGMLLLLITAVWVGNPTAFWLLLVPLVILQVLFAVGMGWMLSVTNLVLRDLQHIMSFVITLLMVLSPIAYTPDMLPAALRPLIWMNPFAYFVLAYQQILMLGTAPSAWQMAALAVLGLGTYHVGYAYFSRMRMVVADYA